MSKSESIIVTIPLDADIVEGIVNGDKVCLNLISKAVQAAIEQGYHLRKAEEPARPAPGHHHSCLITDELWEFMVAYSKVTGQALTEV